MGLTYMANNCRAHVHEDLVTLTKLLRCKYEKTSYSTVRVKPDALRTL